MIPRELLEQIDTSDDAVALSRRVWASLRSEGGFDVRSGVHLLSLFSGRLISREMRELCVELSLELKKETGDRPPKALIAELRAIDPARASQLVEALRRY